MFRANLCVGQGRINEPRPLFRESLRIAKKNAREEAPRYSYGAEKLVAAIAK